MALIVMCSRCGFVLKRIEAEEVSLTARTPLLVEVSRRYGSRCPRCLKLLHLKPETIELQPAGSPLPKPKPNLSQAAAQRRPGRTRILPLTRLS